MARQIIPGPVPPPVRSVNDETGDVEVSEPVVDLGSVSANAAIPLDTAAVYTLTLADDVTLSVSDAPTTVSRVVQVLVTASGARTLSFSSGWLWDGAKPASMLDGAKGILSLTTYGDIIVGAGREARLAIVRTRDDAGPAVQRDPVA